MAHRAHPGAGGRIIRLAQRAAHPPGAVLWNPAIVHRAAAQVSRPGPVPAAPAADRGPARCLRQGTRSRPRPALAAGSIRSARLGTHPGPRGAPDSGLTAVPAGRLLRFRGRAASVHRVQRGDAGGLGVQRRAERAVPLAPGDPGFPAQPCPAAAARGPNVLHALLGAWEQWSGRRDAPVIGILDWSEVPTRSEFLLYQQRMEAIGIRCVVADVRECELVGGRLVAAGTPIDLIYKRVLIHELVGREGLEHPIVRAVRSGAVCMVNPFRCKILHKKASLAVLSDERNAGLFSARERQAIGEHVPWTRVVEDRTTQKDGEPIDLLPWMARHRERLVLKPNDDYGGAGIVLGWEVDDQAWDAAIRKATAEPFIVQERIPLPSESFPSWADGALVFADRIVDTAPFVFRGAFADGCLTRVSTATLVNVTAGGGSTVPTFVVEKRER